MRLLAALLGVSLVACSGPAEDAPEPLDESARLACAPFEELASKYDSLDEDQRAVLAWEVWNNAQFSETTGIRRIGRLVLDVIIENKASVVEITFDDMRQACEGRASPYRTLNSND